jgi:cytochrome c-type biogenesis protein CcmH/NrfG
LKSDSIAFGVAGILFGLLAGWVIGSQQSRRASVVPAQQAAAQPGGAPAAENRAALLDEKQVTAFKTVAEREPSNPAPRVQLGNLYSDAERYDEAIPWYSEALKLDPKNPNVSTDLGIAYYMTNQFDRALGQFDQSLKLDPKHLKTLLNIGVVRAFGKQDLPGAQKVWEQVVAIAPQSEEAQRAQRALESIRSAHPDVGPTPTPGS